MKELSDLIDTRVLIATGLDVIDAILGEEPMADLEFSGNHNLHLGAALQLG